MLIYTPIVFEDLSLTSPGFWNVFTFFVLFLFCLVFLLYFLISLLLVVLDYVFDYLLAIIVGSIVTIEIGLCQIESGWFAVLIVQELSD